MGSLTPKTIVTDQAEVVRLAELAPFDYDRERKKAAERLGIQVTTLDAQVKRVRADTAEDTQQGHALDIEEVEPFAQEVHGDELLDEIVATIQRHVVIDDHAVHAVALWITSTYVIDAAEFAPRLWIWSPTMRCGKTTLLSTINRLALRALPASNISPSSLFRTVEAVSPTLLLDEADTFIIGSEEMRGFLNSGHGRDFAFVIRLVGDEHEPRQFSTFTFIALAMKGKKLPDTVQDRSIGIPMARRKRDAQKIPSLPRRRAGDAFDVLRQKLTRWARDNLNALKGGTPAEPSELNDRAADNWRLMFAIADLAGGDWPAAARRDAVALSGDADAGDADEMAVVLLGDIRDYFARPDLKNQQHVSSEELVGHLQGMPERPWSEWGKAHKPISQNQVARLLKPFGIRTTDQRHHDRILKSYTFANLRDAFETYAPLESPDFDPQSATPQQTPSNKDFSGVSKSATETERRGSKTPTNPITTGFVACCGSEGSKTGETGTQNGHAASFEYEDRWHTDQEADAKAARRLGMSLEQFYHERRKREQEE